MSGRSAAPWAAGRSWCAASLLGASLALGACSNSKPGPSASEPSAAVAPVAAAPVAPTVAAPVVPAAGAAQAMASAHLAQDAGAPSPTVKLVFRTFPARRGVVMWGGQRLGFVDRDKPLVVERPRDSGPLDVVVRVTDYLPVHTRAYTFNDSNIDVKITQLDKKDTLYGYKEPLPPDAGVPFPGEPTDIPE